MKKKILVIGGSSLLGYKILANRNNFEIYASYNKNPINIEQLETIEIDITNKTNCKKILELKPDVIINTAAITNVDYCEKFEKNAFNVNVTGTKNISEIAEKLGSKLIHISTDAVFSGNKKFYTEEDKPNPVNIYGKTKLESEKIVSKIEDNVKNIISYFKIGVVGKITQNGYGFISRSSLGMASGGVFFHSSALRGIKFEDIELGLSVLIIEKDTKKGVEAILVFKNFSKETV